ncbi:P-loop ATPase, Sll1717 family [Microbacterium rhizophilus]|uniref:P-loop ATPase, Sll1717 family n=1 Tax=Microbacterium rhizophilus TaxID=3138934 RepID=UPI0031E7F562
MRPGTDEQHRGPANERPLYASLYFGKSDSRNELNDERGDFIRSFVNLRDVVGHVVSGQRTLVLGPKGTGKSALAWYLDASQLGTAYLASVRDASYLPLAEIPRLQTGQPQGPERTVAAWKFILLCNYLELLLKDQSCHLKNRSEVDRVTKLLRQYGFMGDASGRAILNISTTTVTIPIPKLGNVYQRESSPNLNIYSLLPYLEDWATNARSGNRHVLLLDGLDSIFLNDSKYDESLASLVQAAYSLNQRLADIGATGSVVLLLRNDVFNRVALTLPDSQKMRDDFAVELDWRVLSGAAGSNAPLLQLVNGKAARALGIERVNVLSYFPKNVQLGGTRGGEPRFMDSLQYLLNLTRHTPRDLLRLFEEIRKVEESGMFPPSGKGVLSKETIREGVLQYATKYFVGAIENEFAGYEFGAQESQSGMRALKSMNRQLFDRAQYAKSLAQQGVEDPAVADRLLRLLFFAGAIGNSVERRNRPSYLQFYHRRDDADVYTRGRMVLHNALCHAWNIPFDL